MVKFGFVIDLSRCVGCRTCVEACKVENNTPSGAFWMWVFRVEEGKYPNVRVRFLPRLCQHCNNPPCVKVCPVAARFQREDGFVLTDFNRCIGCRYCQVACPYGVNYFNWKRPSTQQYFDWKNGEGDDLYGKGRMRDYVGGAIPPYKNPDHDQSWGEEKRLVSGGSHYVGVMGKCTWCVHRVAKGLEPACAAACPMRVLNFGDLDDPQSKVSLMLAEKRSFRLLEELNTEPRTYYVGYPPFSEDARILDKSARPEINLPRAKTT